MRADAMLEKGDLEGQAVWKRIVKAVEEIQRTERREVCAVLWSLHSLHDDQGYTDRGYDDD